MQLLNPVRVPRRADFADQPSASAAVGALASSMVSAVEDFLQTMTPPSLGQQRTRPFSRRHPGPSERCRCGNQPCTCCRCDCHEVECEEPCPRCSSDPCDCMCCIGDVDLVVYTRLGEMRVVPIEIHNPRRREREIEIELSEFTTRGGKPAGVQAVVLGAGKVTLGPCETHELILVTRVGIADGGTPDLEAMQRDANDRLPDVDDCLVAVADLRITGCDVRPQRVALAILPRRCAAYEVACKHGCC